MPAEKRSWRPRWLTHRGLVAIEALLVCGVLKDVFGSWVKSLAVAPHWRVLLAMGITIGLFAGLFYFVERFTTRTVAGGHKLARRLPILFPYFVAHAAILVALFFVYANHLGIRVL